MELELTTKLYSLSSCFFKTLGRVFVFGVFHYAYVIFHRNCYEQTTIYCFLFSV